MISDVFPVQVDLQNGFQGNPVVLVANGLEVYRQTSVKTRTQIGLAASAPSFFTPADLALEVSMPTEGKAATLEVRLRSPLFIGVKYDPEDGLTFVLKSSPFRYA